MRTALVISSLILYDALDGKKMNSNSANAILVMIGIFLIMDLIELFQG